MILINRDDIKALITMIDAFAKTEGLDLEYICEYVGENLLTYFKFSKHEREYEEVVSARNLTNIYGTFESIRKRVENEFKRTGDIYNVTYNPHWVAKYVIDDIVGMQKMAQLRGEFPTTPKIKKVHFNGPCTIVLWTDDTKTIVRAENEVFDPEKGLAMAIAKKVLGTNASGSNYYDEFKKWCEPWYKAEDDIEQVDITTLAEAFHRMAKLAPKEAE